LQVQKVQAEAQAQVLEPQGQGQALNLQGQPLGQALVLVFKHRARPSTNITAIHEFDRQRDGRTDRQKTMAKTALCMSIMR